jgi:SulP family sulfate permease
VLIIRLRWVPFIDITGLQTLEEVITDLHRRGVRVMLTGANARVELKLHKAGLIELISQGNLFKEFGEAVAVCRQLAETDPEMAKDKTVVLSEIAEPVPRTSLGYFELTDTKPSEDER